MSSIKNYSLISLLVSSVFLLSACVNVPPVTSGIGSEQLALEEQYSKYLQLHNKELAKRLRISDIKSRKKSGLLQVNLNLTSAYKKSQQLQYQFQWFDKNGFIIEAGKEAWQPIELHGMQTRTIASLAPTLDVTTFSLYVRKVPEKFFKY